MAKERSPNYPSIGFSTALAGTKALYDKERRTAVTLETVAKCMGHSTLSGPATSKVAAVRQYGLIEGAGTNRYRVSDDALTLILKKPGDPEYDVTAARLALKPPIFAELFESFPDASDETLHYELAKHRGFSPDGATKLLRSYRDAVSVAKLDARSYDGARREPAKEESVHVSTVERQRGLGRLPMPEDAPNFPLPDGITGKVLLSGAPTKKALLRLAQRVKEWAEDLDAPEPQGNV